MIRHPGEPGEVGPGVVQEAGPVADADIPLAITHADMNAAHECGVAVPLAQSIPWLVRYRDAWWVVYEQGWLRVIDDLAGTDLNQLSARLARAEAAADRDAAIDGGSRALRGGRDRAADQARGPGS